MEAENVFYSQGAWQVKDSLDTYTLMKSENCYEDVLCGSIYNTHFTYDSDECLDSMFLISCLGLNNCLGCVNLRHKKYCIFNEQYSKEEYEEKLKQYDFGSYSGLTKFKEEYNNFLKTQFRRYAFIYKSVNVTGDNILNCRNSKMIFDAYDKVEDSKYAIHTMEMKDGYDGYGIGAKGESLYEGVDFGHNSARMAFGVLTHSSMDMRYTYMCYSSKNLFGCIGLRNQEYCILNKKYSKKEYEELLPKIIEHMNEMPFVDKKGRVYKYGEFFPTDLCPFAYNETIAGEYFPLNIEKAKEYDFKWKEKEHKDYDVEIKTEEIPDHINDTPDSIVGKTIECMHNGECNDQCTEAFKIVPEELQFYKRMNLALPRLCPNCRHFDRLRRRNPVKIWHRQCMCTKEHQHHAGGCKVEFETSYAPDRPEVIYCEKCYQQEVY